MATQQMARAPLTAGGAGAALEHTAKAPVRTVVTVTDGLAGKVSDANRPGVPGLMQQLEAMRKAKSRYVG